MKKIVFGLLILISANCFSQAREQQTSMAPKSSWLANTPGTELRKAGTCFFIGTGLEVGGVIFLSVGTVQAAASYSNNNSSGSGSVTLGVLMMGTGAVYGILAWVHITRAGRLMDAYKVSFGPTQHGIGLTYKL